MSVGKEKDEERFLDANAGNGDYASRVDFGVGGLSPVRSWE